MNNEIMKTKIMQFIASLLENWRDEKQLPKDRPEIIPVQSTPVIEQQTDKTCVGRSNQARPGQPDGTCERFPAIHL